MRAIGASNGNLVQVFLAEGLILGLLSGLLGLLLAYPAASVLLRFLSGVLFEIRLYFSARSGPDWRCPSSTLLTAVASVLPALGAARFPAQEALRYE